MTAMQKYMTFIDESGVANLNSSGSVFFLSSVVIDKKDFGIIEGYLRLLKREYLGDDFKNLHATDLFERPKKCYPELGNKTNAFIYQLSTILRLIPYKTRLFYVDKDRLRQQLQYSPAKGKKPKGVNTEIAYEIASKQAINDFTQMLIENNAHGEIIIESRLFNDSQFVTSFDEVRKRVTPGGTPQPLYSEVIQRVTSLHIANKHQLDGGLEIADLCAYIGYRHKQGDPKKKVAVTPALIDTLYAGIKNHAYKSVNEKQKRLIYDVTP